MTLSPTGLLIIRAWIEQGPSKPLRAHIRISADVSNGFERETTLTDVSEVSGVVESWLRDALAAGYIP